MILSVFLILVGFALLIVGADLLVDGASGIAKKFHIPEIIIGLTIVSIGTSMPELFVSITSAMDGYSDMALGNVIGSNLCNLLLILGVSTIIKPVVFQKETIKYEIPLCLIITIILMIFCNTGTGISRAEAVALIILFCLFIMYTIVMARENQKGEKRKNEDRLEKENENRNINKRNEKENNKTISQEILDLKEESKKNNTFKNIILIVLGIIGLKVGGDLAVDNAVIVAGFFGLSEKIISLTILAVGTSLPELVTSVTAAIKGNSDVAIGNIIGSNLFNILLILGTSSLIKPIVYNVSYNLDLSILVVATIVLALFPFIPPKKEMSRSNGIIYFLMYIAYIAILILI